MMMEENGGDGCGSIFSEKERAMGEAGGYGSFDSLHLLVGVWRIARDTQEELPFCLSLLCLWSACFLGATPFLHTLGCWVFTYA